MPAARSRSSRDAGPRLLERVAAAARRRRVRGSLPLASCSVSDGADELLLRAVVQVAGEPGAGGVGGLDDAPARGAQLLRARLGDVAVARRLLRLQVLLDVGERGHRPGPSGSSNGAAEYAIRTIEPSLRTSQSSRSCSGSPGAGRA